MRLKSTGKKMFWYCISVNNEKKIAFMNFVVNRAPFEI